MGRFFIILSVVFCGMLLLHGEDIRFDEKLSGWSRSKKADISLDGDFSGDPAVRLRDGARMLRVFDLEPDSIYELSFHVKGQGLPAKDNDGARIMVNAVGAIGIFLAVALIPIAILFLAIGLPIILHVRKKRRAKSKEAMLPGHAPEGSESKAASDVSSQE